MKAFVAVVASLAAAANGQVLLNGAYPYAAPLAAAAPVVAAAPAVATAGVAGVPAAPHAQQFHTQDEFGNLAFGYSNPNSARREEGNTWAGVRNGGWSYVDANGVLQHTEYVADAAGFRVKSTNLPVAPVFNPVLPVAPIDTGVAPAPVEVTPEVAAATAEHLAAHAEAAPAAEERKRRSAQFIPAAPLAGFAPAAYAGGIVGAPAVAGVPGVKQTLQLTPGHATFTRVYNLPGEAELINQA